MEGIYEELVAVISAKCIINGGPDRLLRKMLKSELPLGAVASGASDFVAPGPGHPVIDPMIDCPPTYLPMLGKINHSVSRFE